MENPQNILIFNPPGKLFLRGEDRCQADVSGSAATSLRAPNDLGYMAAVLRALNVNPLIRDYPAEKLSLDDFIADISLLRPIIIIMSITTSTFSQDMKFFKKAKEIDSRIITIAKGSFFYSVPLNLLNVLDDVRHCLDAAICGEVEEIIFDLVNCFVNNGDISNTAGIIYFDQQKEQFVKTKAANYITDLDQIPYPARDLMKNQLYVRPDTGKPMATIMTGRGCPSSCIYCLSPVLLGTQLRKRSPLNIVEEIVECVEKYGIVDFFFMADTFTMDKQWCIELCQEIIKRQLVISWVANSRVKPLDSEILKWMKQAGCWLVSLGIESGNEESLIKMKKGTTLEDARQAVALVKAAGLKVYGFFLIGLPWEDHLHVTDTLKFAKELVCDFVEIHIAVPFVGTQLYNLLPEYGLEVKDPYGYDYFSNPVIGTKYLSREELIKYREQGLKDLYLNPAYILKTLLSIRSTIEFKNYAAYGFRLLKNLFFLDKP